MANILSQAEIDELLNALSSGNDEEIAPEPSSLDNVKAYDFRAANKFPKEQMRTLNIVFQNYAQLFSNQLTGLLRTSCECEVLSVEELSFNEFNNSLPTPVILAIMRVSPFEGSLLMEVSPEAAYLIINRLLGGTSNGTDGVASNQFTEIETALIERILRQLTRIFGEAWEKVFTVSAHIERLETSPQFAQIAALNDPIAITTLNMTVGDESGLISICIPHAAIEPISKQLNTRMLFSGTAQERKNKSVNTELLTGRLINTPVDLTAYFEETPAMVSDILNLQVGDVIRLSQKTEQPLLVKIQHLPKFYAKVGTSGSRYAVQIVDIIKEEQEDDFITR